MWESKTAMLTLLKRLSLCFAECNVKYLNTTSRKSWSTYPTSHSQVYPCSLWSHKSFSSSNNSPSEKLSALLSPEKATALWLWSGLEHHEEGTDEVQVTLTQWCSERKDKSLLSSWQKGHHRIPFWGRIRGYESQRTDRNFLGSWTQVHKPYKRVIKVHFCQYYFL